MPFGKLYTYDGNVRSTAIRAVAKANKLDLEIVYTKPPNELPESYHTINPLGRIPTFVGADGYELTECIAIAIYITSQNEKTGLLGKTKQDYASIVRWMSYANQEMIGPIAGFFRPLIGRDPYNKKSVDDSQKSSYKVLGVLEQHLLVNTFLVGERITLADIFAAGLLTRGFEYLLDKKWRQENPNITRWYETITNQPIYTAIVPKSPFVEEALKNQPPAKKDQPPKKEKEETQKSAPKAAPKPKAKEVVEEEEEEDAPAPRPKHPLEALPKPSLVLDDWKRKYSNEDTRSVALPWFWENFKADEYSIWKLDYKYNEDLTLTFMTSNLIGGFFTRLEASRKYIFGAASVYGTSNDSIVKGAFVIRGQDSTSAFDVAPDYESYAFTKLDPTKEEDRAFVDDQWSWDKPIKDGDRELAWADGKVFK